jgi:hypothetical protein
VSRKQSFWLSALYAVGRISLGMLLHPYQTLQSVVREKVFLWLSILPGVLLVFLIINWRIWTLPVLEILFECQPNYPFICHGVRWVATWVSFFCLYWQILVGYLTIRFLLAFKDE